MGSDLRIFLSSTYTDLSAYRKAVEDLIHEYGQLYVGMEHFGARNGSSLETCLDEVEQSDVVITLIGPKYGSLSDNGRSFTQREVEHAYANDIPVYVFVMEDPGSINVSEARGRARFLRWLERYTWARFDDTTSLVTRVAAALRRFERHDDFRGTGDSWSEIVERLDSAAEYDCVAVTAQNVDRIYPVSLVAADYETRLHSRAIVAGGAGANTACGLSRLGCRSATTGIVGNDSDGDFLKKSLVDLGVVPLLAPPKGISAPTGTTMTFTDPYGRRSIYLDPGINESFAKAARAREYRTQLSSLLRSTRILHHSSFTRAPERLLQESLLTHLPERAVLSFTPGALYCALGLDRLAVLFHRTNVVFLYEQQLDVLLGLDGYQTNGNGLSLKEKIERLYDWKSKRNAHEPLAVIIKNISSSRTPDPRQMQVAVGRTRLEAFAPTQAKIGVGTATRDSTGAGDASAAGFLWSILHRKSLNDAIDVAYVVARSVSEEYGGRNGLPTYPQLRRRWKSWVGSPQCL